MPHSKVKVVVPRARKSRKAKSQNKPAVQASARSDVSTLVKMTSAPLFGPRSKNLMLPRYIATSLSIPNTYNAATFVVNANGMFDPDSTSIGQPLGYDQMMLSFEHYTVIRTTIVVTFRNYTSNIAPTVFIAVRPSATAVADYTSIMEAGNTVATTLLPAGVYGSLKELRMSVDLPRFLGFDDIMDSNEARGSLNTNPTEAAYFHIGGFNNEAIAGGTVIITARVEYHAVFTEPRVLPASLIKGMHALLAAVSESKTQ